VLGHPIAHSLSPVLHRAAYAALGLAWTYDAYDVTEETLPDFVAGIDSDWAGLSLTMPLKVAVRPLLDFVEPMAKLLGVVNTVLVQHSGSQRTLVGANTDVHGIVAALREGGVARATRGVILGGGATAASAMAALAELGCTSPTVAVRSRARAGLVVRAASRMGVTVRLIDFDDALPGILAGADAVVSTVPSGAGVLLAEGVRGSEIAASVVLLDVIYDPLVTELSGAWTAAGGTSVGGERMLLHQAAEQVRLMTGRVAPLEDMDDALRRVLISSPARSLPPQ